MLHFFTAGESHGRGLVGVVEGFPAGFSLSIDAINHHLGRRQKGYGRGKRMAIERDRAVILSGVRQGVTLGSPIAILIGNRDWPNWETVMSPSPPGGGDDESSTFNRKITAPRPGHADLAGGIKYHTHDMRNVLERASARETAARVACGSVARQLLEHFDIRIVSHVLAIGSVRLKGRKYSFDEIERQAEVSPVRCLDPEISKAMTAEIAAARKSKDTLGGIFEVRAGNLPIGLGSVSQWHRRLDAALAAAVMSIPSVKGVEIGDAFASARKRGSKVHDVIDYKPEAATGRSKGFRRRTNTAGGMEGGISNGAEIVIRAACKPISTLLNPLETVDVETKKRVAATVERSDICVVPSAGVVGEAMAAMVLASALVEKFGGDSMAEMEDNFAAYLKREY